MDKRDHKQDEIEAALNSFDGMKRAEVSPFLHARIMAAIEKRHAPSKNHAEFTFRPAFAIAMLAIFLVLNIITINALTKNKHTDTGYREANIAEQYNLDVSTIYDNTNTNGI